MSPPRITILEATGEVPVANPGLDKVVAVFGNCSLNPTAAPTFFGTYDALQLHRGYGPGTRRAGNILNRTKLPVIFVPVPASTPGSYGTIDLSLFTGTAVPAFDVTSTPLNEYEPYVIFTAGTTAVGVAGAKYKTSVDAGRNLSEEKALGTADYVSIANTGIKVLLGPTTASLSALYTSVNNLRTALLAHFIKVSGSPATHASSDTTDNTALTAVAAATTPATAVAAFNACLQYLETHVASAVYHTVADTVATAALALVSTAASTEDVVLGLPALIAAYNAHRILVGAGPVHGSADSTNTCAASTATSGSIVTGDIIGSARTVAPKWATSDLTTAATALANSDLQCSKILISGPCSATEAASVTAMLNTLAAAGQICTAMIESRAQNSGEAEDAWIAAVAADFASFTDDRIARVDGTAWCDFDSPGGTAKFSTSWASHLMSRILLIDRFLSPSEPRQGPIPGVSLTNSAGTLVGHDEAVLGGFDAARGMALYRIQNPSFRAGAYLSHPYVMKSGQGRISQFQVRTVINAIEREANAIAIGDIAIPENYDPTTHLIDVQSANAIAASFRTPLSSDFSKDIANPNDELLAQCDRAVTVDGDDAFVSVTIVPIPFKYIGGITITIAIKVN